MTITSFFIPNLQNKRHSVSVARRRGYGWRNSANGIDRVNLLESAPALQNPQYLSLSFHLEIPPALNSRCGFPLPCTFGPVSRSQGGVDLMDFGVVQAREFSSGQLVQFRRDVPKKSHINPFRFQTRKSTRTRRRNRNSRLSFRKFRLSKNCGCRRHKTTRQPIPLIPHRQFSFFLQLGNQLVRLFFVDVILFLDGILQKILYGVIKFHRLRKLEVHEFVGQY